MIADSLIKPRRGTFEREIRRGGGREKNELHRSRHYRTQKFAPRRFELQLTADFNDPPKQLQQIELPRATDSPWGWYVRGERSRSREKRKGWGWRLEAHPSPPSAPTTVLEDWRGCCHEFDCKKCLANVPSKLSIR